jgi:choice-of-anchor A domain-containing protein
MIQVFSRITLRAALICAALLGLAAIPLASSASATSPACTTVSNPLGAATGYTEFMFGNGQRHSVESEGAVAYGGTLNTGGNMPVGGHLLAEAVPPPTPSTPTLVVAGALSGQVNLAAGSAYVPNHAATSVYFNGGGGAGYLASNPIYFAAALTDLQAKSNAWAAATPNGTVDVSLQDGIKKRITFHGTDPQLNVFTIDANDLHPSVGIVEVRFYYDVPAGAVSIINVTGASASINVNEVRVGTPTGSSNQASDSTRAQT